MVDDTTTKLWVSTQVAVAGTVIGPADLRRHGKVAANPRRVCIMDVVAPDPASNGGAVTFQHSRRRLDRDLCVSPALDVPSFLNDPPSDRHW